MIQYKAIVFFLSAAFLFICSSLFAQQPADTASKRKIIILNADRLNYQKIDSAEFQSAAGNVQIKQDSTLFYTDSVVLNKTLNMLEAFGHVHINDNDSIHTYSDYLRYLGNEKKAYLKGNVKLTRLMIDDKESALCLKPFTKPSTSACDKFLVVACR